MLEKNQRIKSLLYLLLDAALLFIGFLLANYIRFNFVRFFEPGGAGRRAGRSARSPQHPCRAGHLTRTGAHLLGRGHLLQRPPARSGRRCTKIAAINAAGIMIFVAALYLMHLERLFPHRAGAVLSAGHGRRWSLSGWSCAGWIRARRRRGRVCAISCWWAAANRPRALSGRAGA